MKNRVQLPREHLYDLYASGMTLRDIGLLCDVSVETVSNWCKHYGIERRKRGGQPKPVPPREHLLDLCKNGFSIGGIAALYCVAYATAYKWVEQYDLPRRSYRRVRLSQADLIRLYYIEGKTMEEIAKTTGTRPGYVSVWFKDYGIPTRPPGRRKEPLLRGRDSDIRSDNPNDSR